MSSAAVALRAPSSGSHRKTAVLVGVPFLTATATFLVGSGLIVSYFSGASPQSSTLLAGVLLEVVCAVAGLMGFAELDAGWGLIFVPPGGLFELLLPVLIIIRGFSVDRSE